jgi:hypothetical protein
MVARTRLKCYVNPALPILLNDATNDLTPSSTECVSSVSGDRHQAARRLGSATVLRSVYLIGRWLLVSDVRDISIIIVADRDGTDILSRNGSQQLSIYASQYARRTKTPTVSLLRVMF